MRSVDRTRLAQALGMEGEVTVLEEQRRREAEADAARRLQEEREREHRYRLILDRHYLVGRWDREQRQPRVFDLATTADYTVDREQFDYVETSNIVELLEDDWHPSAPDSFISLPAETVQWHDLGGGYVQEGVFPSYLLNLGWGCVHGLRYDGHYPRLGLQVVLPYDGLPLVPPPGIWDCNLPTSVEQGDFVPDGSWQSIFDLMEPLLAVSICQMAEYDHDHWLGIDFPVDDQQGQRQKYYCHASIAGLNTLLKMRYDDASYCYASRGDNRVVIRVPQAEVGLWVGAQGRYAKLIAQKLGAGFTKVVGV